MGLDNRNQTAKEREGKCQALLERQHGLIHFRQARELGYTKASVHRRVRADKWLPVHRSVYRSFAFPRTPEQDIMAAHLALGRGSVASHRSAGYLLGLDGLQEPIVELSLATSGRAALSGAIVHRIGSLPACDITVARSVPVTNASRLLIDVGAVVNEETLELALEDAYRRGLTSQARLEWRIKELCGRGRSGCSSIRKLISNGSSSVTGSGLEVRLHRLISLSDLPPPVKQFEIYDVDRFIARPEFAYPNQLIAVEADSHRWHTSHLAWERELRRRNEMQKLGWIIIHVTRRDIDTRPEEVIDDIRDALRRRGHPGVV